MRALLALTAAATGCFGKPDAPNARDDAGGDDGSIACAMNDPNNGTVTHEPACTGALYNGEYMGHCYQFFNTAMLQWTTAQSSCASMGGYLAATTDGSENGFVANSIVMGLDAWIGARFEVTTTWVTGEDVVYTNWTSSPANPDTCAQLMGAGGWTPTNCTAGYRFPACERPGWTYFEGHTYRHFFAERTWASAKTQCELAGGYLATITTPCERMFVRQLAPYNRVFWLGATDATIEGMFEWVTANEPFEFKSFGDGEPDNGGSGEDCLTTLASSAEWNDAECTQTLPYICERE